MTVTVYLWQKLNFQNLKQRDFILIDDTSLQSVVNANKIFDLITHSGSVCFPTSNLIDMECLRYGLPGMDVPGGWKKKNIINIPISWINHTIKLIPEFISVTFSYFNPLVTGDLATIRYIYETG